MAANLDLEYEKGRDQLSANRCATSSRAAARSRALDYQQALARIPRLIDGFDELFASVTTPSSRRPRRGTAPRARQHRRPGVLHAVDAVRHAGAEPAADARSRRPAARACSWSGRRGDDARLLRTARWLQAQVLAA